MPHRRNQSDGTNDSRRKFLKASGAGAVALSLAGCSSGGDTTTTTTTEDTTTTKSDPNTVTTEEGGIKEGGTFNYGMSAKPDTANVLTQGSVYSALAVNLVYEYGISLDPVTQEIRPNVFTDWKIEGEDKPTVYMKIRDGLKWNDGKDFTVEDALFTYKYCKKNKPGNFASIVEPMEKISKASGDWDMKVKLNKPIGIWESDIVGGLPFLPKHKWEGEDYKKYDPMKANPDNGPVGLGPGRITKFSPDTSMQVVFDNEHYYDTLSNLSWKKEHKQVLAGGPFLDKVNFTVYGSKTAMTQAFLQGEIDTHYGSMKTSKLPQVKKNEGMDIVEGTDSGFSYFGYNLRRKPLDDVSLKQAMSFLFDEHFWVNRLQQGNVFKGDFVQSNGYPVPRPDYQFAEKGEMLTHPATNAFDFRSAQAAVPDIKAIRKFLTKGKVIDGSKGTYAGKDYPGSLSGVKASQSEAKYDYTFGKVKSQVLKNHQSADKEIRVDGKTIPEVMDGDPITMFIDPPKNTPKEAKAIQRWVDNLKSLGIPIKTQALSFNTMVSKVYYQEDFDIYPMGWGGTGPFGSSAYSFFHSDNADDLSKKEGDAKKKNSDSFVYNSPGYGLHGGSADKLLSKARTEMNADKRNKLTAKAIEKIYLDSPYWVMDYAKMNWPVNTEKFGGYIQNLVDPAYASWTTEVNNIHLKE